MKLPFEKRETDFVTWVYIHRAGVCATLAVLLIFGIAFVAWKITFGDSLANQVIYMDMEPPAEPEERPEEVKPVDYGNISNASSNENADLNARLRSMRGSENQELAEQNEGIGDQMDANRAAYEAGLQRDRDRMNDAHSRNTSEDEGKAESSRRGGNVTASYSFTDPVRHDRRLDIPAYRCPGGGRVVVDATLDQNGNVVAAAVARGSATDECLRNEALRSARASSFNLDPSAPARHRGTITYLFVPQ